MERAIGVVEGVSFLLGESHCNALTVAVEILDEILKDEEGQA